MGTLRFEDQTSWISTREAARRLKVSRQRVGQLIASGAVVARRSGVIWLVSGRSVEARIALLRSEGVD